MTRDEVEYLEKNFKVEYPGVLCPNHDWLAIGKHGRNGRDRNKEIISKALGRSTKSIRYFPVSSRS